MGLDMKIFVGKGLTKRYAITKAKRIRKRRWENQGTHITCRMRWGADYRGVVYDSVTGVVVFTGIH